MSGQLHAPQQPCKTTLLRRQQTAKVEFAVRDASRMQCLQEVNDALMDVTARFFKRLKSTDGVALYDVVLHRNLGDSFLWAGSSLLSTRFHRPPKYICAIHQKGGWNVTDDLEFPMCNDEAMLEAIGPNGLVLLHPGGNFGDLWRKVHMGRMLDLQRWAAGYGKVHNWTVVQLPQSIHYKKKKNIEADKAILASLPRGMFHLMVRTKHSLRFARRHFNTTPVRASPDTAFAIGSWFGPKPSVDVLALLRGDHETNAMEENVTTEWLQRKFQPHNLTIMKEDWYYPYHKSQEATKVAITQISLSRVAAGAEQISKGRVVITNRLHAAIMANFVGRPLIWIDTKQKKVNGDLQPQESSALCNAAAQSPQASAAAAASLSDGTQSPGSDNAGDPFNGATPQQPPGNSSSPVLGVTAVAPAAEVDAADLQHQQQQISGSEVSSEQYKPTLNMTPPAAQNSNTPCAGEDSSSCSTSTPVHNTESTDGTHSTLTTSSSSPDNNLSNPEGQSADARNDGSAVQFVLQTLGSSAEPAATLANSSTGAQTAEPNPTEAAGSSGATGTEPTSPADDFTFFLAPPAVGPADESSDNTAGQDEMNQQVGLEGEAQGNLLLNWQRCSSAFVALVVVKNK
eukprot:gene9646-9806_t